MNINNGPILVRDTIVVETAETTYLYAQATRKVTQVRRLDSAMQVYLAGKGFFNLIPRGMHYRHRKNWSTIMLLLGNTCPLACRYCYANAGRNNEIMSVEMADRAVATYLAQKPCNPKVNFFGGGEPSTNPAVIKHLINKYGSKIRWKISTCGVMSEQFLHWLIDNHVGITVSLDGPPHIQNDLRPLRGGGESADIVERTIAILIERGRSVGIRATITKETLNQLDSILSYYDDIGIDRIHVECLSPLGRAGDVIATAKNGMSHLNVSDRIDMAIKGLDWAKSMGKRLRMGGLAYLLNPRIAGYCGPMQGQTMVVNHRGQLTACSEVVDDGFEGWSTFYLGNITAKNELHVRQDTFEYLKQRRVTTMEPCRQCFARYLCRGGCAHKAWVETGNVFSQNSDNCQFVRTAVPLMIQRMAS